MKTVPGFAIVGHPNKGKSSIVATLAEDEHIAISSQPGTTRSARSYAMRLDGVVLYELIDTPGFQRPRQVLEWLKESHPDAKSRHARVCAFLQQHTGDPRFHDECELLKPILEGAGILYVVDGARPYGPEYEAEMEILRWTGQPRMALINPIGSDTHVSSWKRALDQYFSLVRVFDPLHGDFAKRMELLESLSALNESWRDQLTTAVHALQMDRVRRQHEAAEEIVALLEAVLSMRETALLPSADESTEREEQLRNRLLEKLKKRIRKQEKDTRRLIRDLYHHEALEVVESLDPVVNLAQDQLREDLFSERIFTLFGLSRTQLLMTGAASGALAGSGFDLITGGASLLLGAGVGALIGGAGAFFGSQRLARAEILGLPLGGYQLVVGPVTAANFPWVVLGRVVLYFRLISERNHARREALVIAADAEENLADQFPLEVRKVLQKCFDGILRHGALSVTHRAEMTQAVEQLLVN